MQKYGISESIEGVNKRQKGPFLRQISPFKSTYAHLKNSQVATFQLLNSKNTSPPSPCGNPNSRRVLEPPRADFRAKSARNPRDSGCVSDDFDVRRKLSKPAAGYCANALFEFLFAGVVVRR